MTNPIVVAQANGPQASNQNPPRTIPVTKPSDNQAITIHLDGATKLDLSAIANENITLVHVGDRLIILFANHAEVTVEPFYADNGQPLPDITVELGPNHDVTSAQFASDFPITTDQSVLPASGGPNSVSSGANFVSFTVDSFTLPTPLDLLAPETINTTNPNPQINTPTQQQFVPMSLTGAVIHGSADEGGIISDTLHTVGNDPGVAAGATGVAGSLNALVNFGTSGPAASPFQFVSTAAADTWLASLGLTSHGSQIDTATITPTAGGFTLVAGTDPAQGTPHDVFSLTLHADGSWTFTLLNPLDDAPGQGENALTIDLSGLVQAVSASGAELTLAKDFTIVVTDDVPVATSATEAGSVDEGALSHIFFSGQPGDLYGDGNDHDGASATIVGSLSGLVSFGADGPALAAGEVPEERLNGEAQHVSPLVADGFQLAVSTGPHDFGLTSHGQEVNFIQVSNAGTAFETLTAWTNGGAENGGHEVFSLFLDGNGFYEFSLINPIDHPAGDGENSESGTVTLDLSSLVQAVDFDGDAISLPADFKVTIVDDVPVLTGSASFGAVDEGALASAAPVIIIPDSLIFDAPAEPKSSGAPGDLYGDGNDQNGSGSVTFSGSLANTVSFGADGHAVDTNGGDNGFQFAVTQGTHDFNVTSHGQEVNFITLSDVSEGKGGAAQTLTAWTDGGQDNGGHEVFTLTLNGDGAYTFTLINPLDNGPNQDASGTTLDLSNLIQAVDFDGDVVALSGDFQISVSNDAPVLVVDASNTLGSVDEGELSFAQPGAAGDLYGDGNDQFDNGAVVSGSLAGLVAFGADGPAQTQDGATNGFQLVDAEHAAGWLSSLELTSHGASVDTVAFDGNTLIASTDPGSPDGGHEVFSLTLNGDGTYTFTLINPIDQPNGTDLVNEGGEKLTPIDLSGFVQAVDFDGDAVPLSGDFTVTVIDDVPVLNPGGNESQSVDEGALAFSSTGGDLYGDGNDQHGSGSVTVSGSLANLVSFGADGHAVDDSGANAGFQLAVSGFSATHDFGVTSHGQEVNLVTINDGVDADGVTTQTLTAWTNGPALSEDSHQVFRLTLHGDGTYTFTLINPIDNGGDAAPTTLDFSSLIKAVDFDGDAVPLSGDFSITISNDVPVIAAADAGSVDEGGLVSTNGSGTDPFGAGNDADAATEARGSLGIHFGADGPVPGTFVTDTFGINNISQAAAFAETHFSTGGNFHFTGVGSDALNPGETQGALVGNQGTTITITDAAGEFALTSIDLGTTTVPGHTSSLELVGLDAHGEIVASATLSAGASGSIPETIFNAAGTAFDGVELAKLELVPGDSFQKISFNDITVTRETATNSVYFSDQTTAANNITVTDADGHTVALSNLTSHGETLAFALLNDATLVAYTGETAPTTLVDASVVFSVSLSAASANGSYDFLLDKPLDQPLSGEDALHLTFNYTAKDFDGDTASGTFTVSDTDDVPALTGITQTSGSVDEGALYFAPSPTPGDLYGDGNDHMLAGASTSFTGGLSGLVSFGADGPAANEFQFSVKDGDTHDFGVKSHGAEVDYVQISKDGHTLTAWTEGGPGGGGHAVFSLALTADGIYTFTLINPIDDAAGNGENSATINLGTVVQAMDHDGDAVGLSDSFAITVVDDVPVQNASASAVSGTVDEGAIPSDPWGSGNDVGVASASFTAASGSLEGLVHFGADGPAATAFQMVDAQTADRWLATLGLTSHGLSVDSAQVDQNVLTAYDSNNDPVFTFAVGGDGSWMFNLLAPLDHPNANGENSLTVDLTGLIQAVDYDGDPITLQDPIGPVSATLSLVNGHYDTLTTGGVTIEGLDFNSASDPTSFTTGTIQVSTQGLGVDNNSIGDGQGIEISRPDTDKVSFDLFKVGNGDTTVVVTWDAFNGDSTTPSDQGTAAYEVSAAGTLIGIDPTGTFDHLVIDFGVAGNDKIRLDDIGYTGSGSQPLVSVNVIDDVPVVASATVSATVNEGGLTGGNEPSSATSAGGGSGSLETLVHFGADGANATPFGFTVADGDALSLGLTSQGHAVDFASVSGNTLTAWTGGGPTDQNAHAVFALTLGTDGSWTFQLDAPIDHNGTDSIDLSSLVQAVDFDGDAVTLASGELTVTVTDDAPALVAGAAALSGTVNEGGLTSTTDPFGSGNEPSSATSLAGSTGTLDTLVHFGADGANATPFQFTVANGGALSLGLTSHGQSVDYAAVSGNTLTAWTGNGPNDNTAHKVFDLTLNTNGSWIFHLDGPIDHNGSATVDLSSLVKAVDFDGSSVTLAAHELQVVIVDDAPVAHLVPGGIVQADDTGAQLHLTAGTDYAFGADGSAASSPIVFDTSSAQISGPPGETFGTPTYSTGGNSIDIQLNNAFQELSAGESATLTIPYTVTDFDGSSATNDLVVTIDGVNTNPAFSGSPPSPTVDEVGNVTSGTATDTTSGVVHFTDVNYDDTHTVSATYVSGSAVWSGAALHGGTIPTQTMSDLLDALTVLETQDSTHAATGNVAWTASIADSDLDFLANGETLSATFNVTVDDNHGGSATEQVVVTFDGANDPTVITTADKNESGSFASGGGGTDTASGVIHFTDADLNDRPTPQITNESAFGGNGLTLTTGEIATLENALTVAAVAGDTNDGTVVWNYSIADSSLTFIQAGETATVSATVQVSDGHGGSDTSTVTVNISGAPNHPPIITSGPQVASLTNGHETAGGNLIQNGGFESGLTGWTNGGAGPVLVVGNPHTGSGSASIIQGSGDSTLSQTVDTVAGEHYVLDFWLMNMTGSNNDFSVSWNGTTLDSYTNIPATFTPPTTDTYIEHEYTVVGTGGPVTLTFAGNDHDNGPSASLHLDDVSLTPGAEAASNLITFIDPDVNDTHTVSYVPDGIGYLGTFTPTLTHDSTGGVTGDVNWTFNVSDAALSGLPAGTSTTQHYTVTIADNHGASTTQDVAVTLTNPVSVLADQTHTSATSAGPEATANHFSIPVLSLLEADTALHQSGPLNYTATSVSGVSGVSLTSDHDYVLFPFLNSGTSGTFTLGFTNGTVSGFETVTVNMVDSIPTYTTTSTDQGGLNGNDFLIENRQDVPGVLMQSDSNSNDILVANTHLGSSVVGFDSLNNHGPLFGDGNDVLIGANGGGLEAGDGNDTLWLEGGVPNADGTRTPLEGNQAPNTNTTFYFNNPGDAIGTDQIGNFDVQSGQQDVIAISASGFNAAAGSTIFTAGQSVTVDTTTSNGGGKPNWTHNDTFMYDTTDHGLYYSDNGTGGNAHLVLLATITNHTVTGSDVHIVA